MSFDLDVWYEPIPITNEDARQKHDRALDGESVFIPHPNVAEFHARLMERFPAEALDDASVVWAVTPRRSDRWIELYVRWGPVGHPVIPFVIELAEQLGLVLFDRQDGTVYLPPALLRTVRLQIDGGPELTCPEPDVVAHQVRKALGNGSVAVLRSEPQRYVQAHVAAREGTPRPVYGVEYRDGSAERHFRYETDDLDQVLAVFEAFTRSDDGHQALLDWYHFPL